MSFLGLGGGAPAPADPDAVTSARVVVVGNPGCGKTSLVHALVHGRPPARPAPTVGCSVQVKLLSTDARGDAFIELWDVGGGRRTASLRRLWYGDVSGVIVCHDLSGGGATTAATTATAPGSVRAWMHELASSASFHGAVGGGDRGRLPVPLLIVGTKADAAPRGSRRSPRRGGGGPLAALAAAVVARVSPARGGGTGLPSRASSNGGPTSPPPTRAGVATATTAAVTGDLDAAAFDEFFKAVLAQRAAGGSPAPGGGAAAYPGGGWGAGAAASPAGRMGVADVDPLGDDDDLV